MVVLHQQGQAMLGVPTILTLTLAVILLGWVSTYPADRTIVTKRKDSSSTAFSCRL